MERGLVEKIAKLLLQGGQEADWAEIPFKGLTARGGHSPGKARTQGCHRMVPPRATVPPAPPAEWRGRLGGHLQGGVSKAGGSGEPGELVLNGRQGPSVQTQHSTTLGRGGLCVCVCVGVCVCEGA